MRVLVLTKGLAVGGAEVLIESSSRYWDRDAFDYHVAFLDPELDQLAPPMRERGLPVTALAGVGPAGFRTLRSTVRRLRPHLIHAHLPVAGIMSISRWLRSRATLLRLTLSLVMTLLPKQFASVSLT